MSWFLMHLKHSNHKSFLYKRFELGTIITWLYTKIWLDFCTGEHSWNILLYEHYCKGNIANPNPSNETTVSFIILHCRTHWPCWLRTWGGGSSLTKTLISQSASSTFASAFTFVTLALCVKCRRTLEETLVSVGYILQLSLRVLPGKIFSTPTRILPRYLLPPPPKKNIKFYDPNPGPTWLYSARTRLDWNNLSSPQN